MQALISGFNVCNIIKFFIGVEKKNLKALQCVQNFVATWPMFVGDTNVEIHEMNSAFLVLSVKCDCIVQYAWIEVWGHSSWGKTY